MVDDDGGATGADRGVRRVDEILTLLFAAERRGLGGRRLDRLRSAECDLRRCLVVHAAHLLTGPELALLELEQQLDPVGAAERVASAEVVLLVLPLYLADPRWHGEDLEDRRLRIRLAEDLARQALALPELAGRSWECALGDVEVAIEDARRELRRARTSETSNP